MVLCWPYTAYRYSREPVTMFGKCQVLGISIFPAATHVLHHVQNKEPTFRASWITQHLGKVSITKALLLARYPGQQIPHSLPLGSGTKAVIRASFHSISKMGRRCARLS